MQPHEQWLARAEEDLSFAQLGFREKYFSQTCFLSQQVVEIATDLDPLKDDLKLIDEFYIPTRYPDAVPGGLASGLPGPDEAKSALETAATILQLIRSRI